MNNFSSEHDSVKRSVFASYRFCPYTYRLYDSRLRFIHSCRYRYFFQQLSAHKASINVKSILEVGCSDLFTLAMLCGHGYRPSSYVGVDIFWEGAEEFAKENAEKIHRTFMVNVETRNQSSELAAGNASFDTAFMLETLEHLPKEKETLQNIFVALKPGGILFLTVPIEFGVLFAIKEIARRILSGSSDYTIGEFFMALFGRMEDVRRIVGDHKGYDFRKTCGILLGLGFELLDEKIYPGPTAYFGYSHISVWKKPNSN